MAICGTPIQSNPLFDCTTFCGRSDSASLDDILFFGLPRYFIMLVVGPNYLIPNKKERLENNEDFCNDFTNLQISISS